MANTTPLRDAAKLRLARLASQQPKANFDFDRKTGEIWLEGEFGQGRGGIDAKAVRSALREIGNKPIRVCINSQGGSVTEGFACYSLLADHPSEVSTHVVGIAASMASLVAQVGSRRFIDKHALMMIHLPHISSGGNSDELRKQAAILEKVEGEMLSVYARRTGKTEGRIRELLAAETWFSAREAVDAGFCDALDGQYAATAPQLTLEQARASVANCRRRTRMAAHSGVPFIATATPHRCEFMQRLIPRNIRLLGPLVKPVTGTLPQPLTR